MDIIQVPVEVGLIAYLLFPKPALINPQRLVVAGRHFEALTAAVAMLQPWVSPVFERTG